MIFCNISSLHL